MSTKQNQRIEQRRIEIGLEEVLGGVTTPDLAAAVERRHAAGDTVADPQRPSRRYGGTLAAAAALVLGITAVLGTIILDRGAAQEPIRLEPIEVLEPFDVADLESAELFTRERLRLLAWLSRDGHWDAVLEQPERVHWFNDESRERGGPLTGRIHWYPRPIRQLSISAHHERIGSVPLFDVADLARLGERKPPLLELVAIDARGERFGSADFDATKFVVGRDDRGNATLKYAMRPQQVARYRAFSKRLTGSVSIIASHGVVLSTPTFMAPIAGVGELYGTSAAVRESIIAAVRAKPGVIERHVLEAEDSANAMKHSLAVEARRVADRSARRDSSSFGGENPFSAAQSTFARETEAGLEPNLPNPAWAEAKHVVVHGFILRTGERGGRSALLVESLHDAAFGVQDVQRVIAVRSKTDLGALVGEYCRIEGTPEIAARSGGLTIGGAEVRAVWR